MMGTLQGSWIWYELMTPDPDGAKAFYDAVVGVTVQAAPSDEMDYRMIACPDGALSGGVMRLTDEMMASGGKPCWVGYIGVDDVDAAVEAIRGAGGSCHVEPFDIPGTGRIAMVTDCDSAPFYVMTPVAPEGGGESTAFSAERNPGHVGWNELMAGDADEAHAFYTGQFGWTDAGSMPMGEMGDYRFVAHDGVTHGAIMRKMPGMPVAQWNHYLWVPSIAAAQQAIEAGGGQVISGPMQVPGDDWIVQGIDPQGAPFNLVGGR